MPTGENTIGRSEECDVCIATKSLSRTHATLLVDGGTHFIQDLGSRNKTYRGKVSNWDSSKDGHFEASQLYNCRQESFKHLCYEFLAAFLLLGHRHPVLLLASVTGRNCLLTVCGILGFELGPGHVGGGGRRG